jgi:hypothetical protein
MTVTLNTMCDEKTVDTVCFINNTQASKIFSFYVTYFGLISDYNISIGQILYAKLFTLLSMLYFFVPPIFVAKIARFL